MAMMNYEIWQLQNVEATSYAFCSWSIAEGKFDISHYWLTYQGTAPQKNILENLFAEFNLNHPKDFPGHSLSVSDVVALKKEDKDYWYWYYCDSFGWKEITEFVQPIMY